jgi:hypothetical protein
MEGLVRAHSKPVFPRVAYIARNLLASIVDFAGILEAFSHDFQQLTLLGITSFRLSSGHGEEGGVEFRKVILEEIAVLGLDGRRPAQRIVEAGSIIPLFGEQFASISSLQQMLPEVGFIVHAARQTQANAANGNHVL